MSFIGNPILTMNYPVDYFTGDGTKTNFLLSRIPASTTSLIVTINGVKQIASYSNSDYYLNGNTMIFNSAPANGAEIEVLHLGVLSQVNVPGNQTIVSNMLASNLTFSGNTVISASSSLDALRITQTGSGNALIVEDSANPDASPFVVTADGYVGIGQPTPGAKLVVSGAGITSRIESVAATGVHEFLRCNNTIASPTAVTVGAFLGQLKMAGYDGASYIYAAQIDAIVDGTPGTNDMPGRLVFSTTADGASSPTERMRIDNAGRVGIGATAGTTQAIRIGNSITGGTTAYGLFNAQVIRSDVTSSASYFTTSAITESASFALNTIRHYYATQGTFGAGSSVTNQYGFSIGSDLIGSTNNYGFHSNIASGTGRYNFYAAGTADNYFAGAVGIGSTTLTGYNLRISKALTGGVDAVNAMSTTQVNSDVTSSATIYQSQPSTQATAFTLNNLYHFLANQGTIGAGSAVNNQFGFSVSSALTGATNNFGFYSNIASGTGRYNFYAGGTADNYLAGSLGIGIVPNSYGVFFIGKTVTGQTSGSAAYATSVGGSDVTSGLNGFTSRVTTSAAAYTLNSLAHFSANPQTKGSGSTITAQYGFIAENNLTEGVGNTGFYSNIASGTGRYNFFAAGTAENYFAGKVGIGTLPSINSNLIVAANRASYPYSLILSSFNGATFENDLVFAFNGTRQIIGNYQSYPLTFQTNNASRLTIDSSGNVGIGTLTPTSGYMFDVAGKIILSGTGPELRLNNGGPWLYVGTANSLDIGVSNVASTANSVVTVNTTGVGIGTTSPSSRLHVRQDQDGTTRSIIQNRNASGTPLSELTFLTGAFDLADNRQAYIRSGGGSSTYLAFGTSNGNPPVEAFRINPTATTTFNYSIGIGGVPVTGYKVLNYGSWTGATTYYAFASQGTIASDVTTTSFAYRSSPNTQVTTFTHGNMIHYGAEQGVFGAGSTVTNQFGHWSGSLTGATNNFGFYSNTAAGTGRYSFYAAGTADNYFAGKLGIGVTPSGMLTVLNPASTASWAIHARSSGILNDSGIWFDASNNAEFAARDGSNNLNVVLRTSGTSYIVSGNVGIGTSSPSYKLQVNGSFAATTKSFVIDHPTKPGKKLRYGSLEGPENGVYVRGKIKGSNVIELPEYWTKLVDPDSITVQLTSIGKHQNLYVEDIVDNTVIVSNSNLLNKEINCFYIVHAERIDVDKLDVEIE